MGWSHRDEAFAGAPRARVCVVLAERSNPRRLEFDLRRLLLALPARTGRLTQHRIAVRALALLQERKTILIFTFVGNCTEYEKAARPEFLRLYAEARTAALAGDTRATVLAVARLLSYADAYSFYGWKLGADPAFADFTHSPECQRLGSVESCCEVREPFQGDAGLSQVRVTRYREGHVESTQLEPAP